MALSAILMLTDADRAEVQQMKPYCPYHNDTDIVVTFAPSIMFGAHAIDKKNHDFAAPMQLRRSSLAVAVIIYSDKIRGTGGDAS